MAGNDRPAPERSAAHSGAARAAINVSLSTIRVASGVAYRVRDIVVGLGTTARGGWSPSGSALLATLGAAIVVGMALLVDDLQRRGVFPPIPIERQIAFTVAAQTITVAGVPIRSGTAKRLKQYFDDYAYDIAEEAPRTPIPRLVVAALPKDLGSVKSVASRKNLFFKTVLPLVLIVNEWLTDTRRDVKRLHERVKAGDQLTSAEHRRLDRLFTTFRVEQRNFDKLVRRADVVPVALALGQAAIESGWGMSRFAQQGNALYGQWTWAKRRGLVPEARAEGASHSVRAFGQLADSVAAYMRNLNTHPAYADFRRMREAMRRNGEPPKSEELAWTLHSYSQRGLAYVEDILKVIRQNRSCLSVTLRLWGCMFSICSV